MRPVRCNVLWWTCFTVLVISLLGTVSYPQGKKPFRGFLDSFGYGYEVSVSVNGTPIKVIHGGGQQATRLFSTDHPARKMASAEQRALFLLREGENTITVQFRRLEDAQTPLEVKLEVPDRYNKPLFRLQSATLPEGKFERTFRIERTMPQNFKTVEISDQI
jgi:hypothetical protein